MGDKSIMAEGEGSPKFGAVTRLHPTRQQIVVKYARTLLKGQTA